MFKHSKKIALRLAGGLGNQIFQVMAGILLSQRTGQLIAIFSEGLSTYHAARTPEVLRLLSSPRIVIDERAEVCPMTRWISVKTRAGRWLPLAGLNDKSFPKAIGDSHRAHHVNFLDGYFQRGWTTELLAEVLAEIRVTDFPGSRLRAAPFDCLVHIRGGDFLRHTSHAILDTDYYDRCFELAREAGCRSFGIITDDLTHANQVTLELRRRHPTLTMKLLPVASDPLQDFATLRHARRRIISNSTFAWWATALDENRGQTWSPDRFVRDMTRDFFLPHELTVPAALNLIKCQVV